MKDLLTVKSILIKHYDLKENPTYIFGSRANNTKRADSDLDILIMDKTINPETVTLINEEFEESTLLYKVDIVLKSRVDNQFFKKIESQLKPL
jgi:predicted nucleotidyltransferase